MDARMKQAIIRDYGRTIVLNEDIPSGSHIREMTSIAQSLTDDAAAILKEIPANLPLVSGSASSPYFVNGTGSEPSVWSITITFIGDPDGFPGIPHIAAILEDHGFQWENN